MPRSHLGNSDLLITTKGTITLPPYQGEGIDTGVGLDELS